MQTQEIDFIHHLKLEQEEAGKLITALGVYATTEPENMSRCPAAKAIEDYKKHLTNFLAKLKDLN